MADGIVAGLRQPDLEARALGLEEGVRDLDEDAATVAGDGIGAHRATVLEVLKDIKCILDDVVRGPASEIGDKADPAGIVLALGIEQPPRRRDAERGTWVPRGDVGLRLQCHWPMPSGSSVPPMGPMGISVAHAPRPARDPRRSGGGNQPSAIAEPNAAGHWPAFGPPASPPCLPDRTGMALQYR